MLAGSPTASGAGGGRHVAVGKPVQNAFVGSLNGRFDGECFNEHSVRGSHMARRIIEA